MNDVNLPTQSSAAAETPLSREWGYALRYWLRGRRAYVAAAIVLGGGGLALGWGWLAAVGVLPILLAALPCAAMCAIGLCMPKEKK